MTEIVTTQNFDSGAFVISRSIFESEIWYKPPEYLKIWLYLIGKANHKGRKYRGYYCERGQYFCNYKELREQLSYKIGYRNKKYGDFAPKTLMKYLRKTQRITTTKKPRGILVTIINYDTYQTLGNYEKTSEETNEETTKKPQRNQKPLSINKNYKNEKNFKNIYSQNSDEFRLSELLLNLILERNPEHKRPDLQKWAGHVDRMIRLDSRRADDIETVIEWCQANEFWQNNIISTQKLRDKFDQLKMKMEAENNKLEQEQSKSNEINWDKKLEEYGEKNESS
jgi:hypothetical protein